MSKNVFLPNAPDATNYVIYYSVFSDEWCKYENYHEQNGYRSSSTENMRSDLDYSYSEASNQADRRSCYECKL